MMRTAWWLAGIVALTAAGCWSEPSSSSAGSGGASSASAGSSGSGGAGGMSAACEAPPDEATLLASAKNAFAAVDTARGALYQALFDLAPDGTLGPNGLDSIDWDPTHDSVLFTPLDVERNLAFLVSNDAAKNPQSAHATLGLAADTGTGRYVLFGANAPSDLALMPPVPGSGGDRMKTLLNRVAKWLVGHDLGDGTGVKLVFAHLADNYWFHHDEGTPKFFAEALPKATMNAEDSCESTALAGCLKGASLLVISDEMGDTDDDYKAPVDVDAVMQALTSANQQGIPILYVEVDGQLTPLGERMMAFFRAKTDDNYWNQERLTGFSPKSLSNHGGGLDDYRALVDTLSTNSLAVSDYASCIGQVSQFADCDAKAFADKVGRGAAALRASLVAMDEQAIDPFAGTGYALPKLFTELGDDYRAALSYPVAFDKDAMAFARAVVADSTVHIVQACNRAQSNLGTYVCPRSQVLAKTCAGYDVDAVPRLSRTIDEPFGIEGRWTSTGLYALPGKTFTVHRSDKSHGAVSVRLAFHREGTTRSLETGSDGTRYDRPAYLASPWVTLRAGEDVNVTSPYGGPVYLRLDGEAAPSGDKATVAFEGVAEHAALLDVGDDAAVASFVTHVMNSPLPHADIRGVGFEVHMRKDRLLAGVGAPYELASHGDGTGLTVDYKNDLGLLLADFRDNYVAPEYTLAGFAPPGKTLATTLSADVQAVCSHLGWDCLSPTVHVRAATQHANYDEYANCGDGCSGNPFDADWPVSPLGWGESHELGHNLQMGVLQIGYVTDDKRDDWSQYQSRAGENSNNIFPYHNLWRYGREVRKDVAPLHDGHMNLKTLFAMVQSSRAKLVRTVNGTARQVVFDEGCSIVGDYPLDAKDVHVEAIWQDGGYAATNGPRMGFYLGLPMRLHGRTLSDGTKLSDGFDVFTLLYAEARLFLAAARDDASWTAAREALGFGSFARTGDPTYAGADVTAIPGNDFLLVALSHLSGQDFRPYFDDHGVRYSTLASQEVDAHIASGLVKGAIASALIVLDDDLPGADLASLTTVAPDGVAAWPRDGFHPSTCP